MKKTLSVILAVLMIALTMLPAFATGTYSVEFVQPSVTLETVDGIPAYYFVKTDGGNAAYGQVENGTYVYFNQKYMPISNVIEPEQYDFQEFYGPKIFAGAVPEDEDAIQAGPNFYLGSNVTMNEGDILSFVVMTNEVYNAATASVCINGSPISPEANGEYRVVVDRNLQISVREDDGNGNDVLLRNMFSVTMPSDEGYNVKTLEGQNYALVPYGGSFSFRVKISKGYTDSGMSVKVTRGSSGIEELIGDDVDISGIVGMLPQTEETAGLGMSVETLSSTGVDSNGYRTYTIDNITDNCKISVSGVREESSSNFLSILKRVLKLILDFFGIENDLFASLVNVYDVSIISPDSDKISYTVTSGSTGEDIAPSAFTVSSGDSVTIQVATTYADCDAHVGVSWTYKDADGNVVKTIDGKSYNSTWAVKRNDSTGKIYYSRLFVIDNITNNVTITISEK